MSSNQHESINSLGYEIMPFPTSQECKWALILSRRKVMSIKKPMTWECFKRGRGNSVLNISNSQNNPSVTNQLHNSATNPIINNSIFGTFVGSTKFTGKNHS